MSPSTETGGRRSLRDRNAIGKPKNYYHELSSEDEEVVPDNYLAPSNRQLRDRAAIEKPEQLKIGSNNKQSYKRSSWDEDDSDKESQESDSNNSMDESSEDEVVSDYHFSQDEDSDDSSKRRRIRKPKVVKAEKSESESEDEAKLGSRQNYSKLISKNIKDKMAFLKSLKIPEAKAELAPTKKQRKKKFDSNVAKAKESDSESEDEAKSGSKEAYSNLDSESELAPIKKRKKRNVDSKNCKNTESLGDNDPQECDTATMDPKEADLTEFDPGKRDTSTEDVQLPEENSLEELEPTEELQNCDTATTDFKTSQENTALDDPIQKSQKCEVGETPENSSSDLDETKEPEESNHLRFNLKRASIALERWSPTKSSQNRTISLD